MTKVSVIIPCYNQGHFVDEAIDSALGQTFGDLDIIVVNDGSTDPRTISHLSSLSVPRTRVLHTRNCGLAGARNNGIAATNARYVLPLDADDKLAPTYVERAVAVLEAQPGVGVVFGGGEFFGARKGRCPFPPFSAERMLVDNCVNANSIFRRELWVRAGGYCTDFRSGCEDWDFWLSVLELGASFHDLGEVAFHYRQHPTNMTHSMNRDIERRREIFARLVERHPRLYEANLAAVVGQLAEYKVRYQALMKRPVITLYRKLSRLMNAWED